MAQLIGIRNLCCQHRLQKLFIFSLHLAAVRISCIVDEIGKGRKGGGRWIRRGEEGRREAENPEEVTSERGSNKERRGEREGRKEVL